MKIRIYNAITRDGYVLDKKGEHFLYFTADKKDFLKMYQEADCLVVDHDNYEYLTKVGVLPATKKFVVVMTDEIGPKGQTNIWFTGLEPKQIKREIKIQGYKNALCLLNNQLSTKVLAQKIATEVMVSIYHDIEGGGVEKVELVESISKKTQPIITTGKDFEKLNFVIKKA